MSNYQIITADVMNWLNLASRYNYRRNYYHAFLSDAPYHLTSITDRFGKNGSAPAKGDVYARASRGFMGQQWDGGDLAFNSELWAGLREMLMPGAFGFAFAGSRGWHRMACAIEDAGFVFHPTNFLLGWSYGCLSEDTEILTKDGWQKFNLDLTGSMVMGYNVGSNSLEWMEVQETYEYDYDDTAYHIQSDSTDQIVSRNHRCLVERNGKFVFRQAEVLQPKESVPILETLPEMWQTFYSRCIRNSQSDSLSRLWEEPEGETQGQDYNLSGMRNKEIQAKSMAQKDKGAYLFKSLQWSTQRQGMGQARLQGPGGLDGRDGAIGSAKDDWSKQSGLEGWHYIPYQKGQLRQLQHQVCEMPPRAYQHGPQRRLCDGASIESSQSVGQTTETLRGGPSRQSQSRGQQTQELNAIQQQYSSQEIRSDRKPSTTLATITPIHYKGKVWCVRVPTGAFVARRNGRVFITGNSGFPKATRVKDNGQEIDGWQSHRYGLQAIKPALEPILCFQKPYEGRPVDSITAIGAGALNIDGGRIPGAWSWGTQTDITGGGYGSKRPSNGDVHARGIDSDPGGRWPANLLLEHTPECRRAGVKRINGNQGVRGASTRIYGNGKGFTDATGESVGYADPDGLETVDNWQCIEGCPVRRLGEQSGILSNGGPNDNIPYKESVVEFHSGLQHRSNGTQWAGDSGTATRYFHQSHWGYEILERIAESDPTFYTAKASSKERNAGLKNEQLMKLRDDLSDDERNYVLSFEPTKGDNGVDARNIHPT